METVYQLRKIGLPASVERVKNVYRLSSDTTCIGRGNEVDIFLDSSIRKGLISRAHSQIIKKEVDGKTAYEIFDTSLNGTYVNDVRIRGSVILTEGDTIAFGHLRGSLLEPGALAPQKETEFLFKFEKCLHPEIKEEMVDLTESERHNNSSVFMSPKSHTEEEPLAGVNSGLLEYSPVIKKMKSPPADDDVEIKYHIKDEKDFKDVVDDVIDKITNGEDSEEDSFLLQADEKISTLGSEEVVPAVGTTLTHPRERVLSLSGSCANTPSKRNDHDMINLVDSPRRDPNAGVKTTPKNKKGGKGKENWVIESDMSGSEIEIESESESEYLESDYDSEKSEEIPDDSSDTEYVPEVQPNGQLTKRNSPRKIITPEKLKSVCNINNRTTAQSQVNNHRKKNAGVKKNNGVKKDVVIKKETVPLKKEYVHDVCASMNCKRPSGALKTVTWVQCDDCDGWYHVLCSGLSEAVAKRKDTIFRCGCL